MNLDPKTAQTIVDSMKSIFHHEINFFDTTGIVIASTDKSRIGTGHEGARIVLRTKRPIVIDHDDEYEGAREGINAPVLFNDDAIAVIGITGTPEEVRPFGDVLSRMTEILVRESWEHIVKFDQRMNVATLTNMLCWRRHDSETINYLASILGIDLSQERCAVVGGLMGSNESLVTDDSLYTNVSVWVSQLRDSFFSLTTQELCMFVDGRAMRDLPKALRGIQDGVQRYSNGATMSFGIGSLEHDSSDYWKSHREATDALRWPYRASDDVETIRSYEDALDDGVLLASIPVENAHKFVHHILADLPADELDEFERIFDSYTRNNGSILRSSQELFLHKNTMQNRLNKIWRVTGHNPRELNDYVILAMAFRLRDYLASHGTSGVPTQAQKPR